MIKQKPNGSSLKRETVLFALLTFFCASSAIGTSSEDDQIVVPLQWVRPSEEVLADFSWPGLDFEDRGWVRKRPIESGLRGLPPTDRILFYGIFDLSAESIVLSRSPEKARNACGRFHNAKPPTLAFPGSMRWTPMARKSSTLTLITTRISRTKSQSILRTLGPATLFMGFERSQRFTSNMPTGRK